MTETGRASYGVIGGGVSGLACARMLTAAGARVVVFDKARRPGGRACTRRSPFGSFDHGAQYFTARAPEFSAFVRECVERGHAAEWKPRLAKFSSAGITPFTDDVSRFVGVPGMSALARQLSEGVDCRCSQRAVRLGRAKDGWRIGFEDGRIEGPFDRIVLALPSAQAAELLPASDLRRTAANVGMTGAWAVMVMFSNPLDVPFDAAWVSHSPIAWIANEASKPGRERGARWMLHSSPSWHAATEDAPPRVIAGHLVGALSSIVGRALPPTVGHIVHRWMHALPHTPHEAPFLFDPALGVAACGDWCGGPRVEGAFQSGTALARHLTSAEASASE